MSILVTGATGMVGRHVVDRLVSAGCDVRAVTRNPGSSGLPASVNILAGDLDQPESLRPALRGVRSLYLFPVPATAAQVVDLAVRAGVQRIVVLSSSSVGDTDSHSGQHHLAVEQAVAASGVEWSFVRPDEFASNVLWKWGHSIRSEGVVRAPYPLAVRVPIHEADVAAVAAQCLLQDGHAGASYELTGPEAITQIDQVRAISAVIGRPITFEEQTADEARKSLGQWMPAPVVDMVVGYLADAVEHPPAVTTAVEDVTGRPAVPFRQWVSDHRADFQPFD